MPAGFGASITHHLDHPFRSAGTARILPPCENFMTSIAGANRRPSPFSLNILKWNHRNGWLRHTRGYSSTPLYFSFNFDVRVYHRAHLCGVRRLVQYSEGHFSTSFFAQVNFITSGNSFFNIFHKNWSDFFYLVSSFYLFFIYLFWKAK